MLRNNCTQPRLRLQKAHDNTVNVTVPFWRFSIATACSWVTPSRFSPLTAKIWSPRFSLPSSAAAPWEEKKRECQWEKQHNGGCTISRDFRKQIKKKKRQGTQTILNWDAPLSQDYLRNGTRSDSVHCVQICMCSPLGALLACWHTPPRSSLVQPGTGTSFIPPPSAQVPKAFSMRLKKGWREAVPFPLSEPNTVQTKYAPVQ